MSQSDYTSIFYGASVGGRWMKSDLPLFHQTNNMGVFYWETEPQVYFYSSPFWKQKLRNPRKRCVHQTISNSNLSKVKSLCKSFQFYANKISLHNTPLPPFCGRRIYFSAIRQPIKQAVIYHIKTHQCRNKGVKLWRPTILYKLDNNHNNISEIFLVYKAQTFPSHSHKPRSILASQSPRSQDYIKVCRFA